MNPKEFLNIIDKYLKGEATPQEENLLKRFFDSYQNERSWNETELGNASEEEAVLLARLRDTLKRQERRPAKLRLLKRQFRTAAAAAAVFLVLGSFWWWRAYRIPAKSLAVYQDRQMKTGDLLPAGNKAILTLGDGTMIGLDSAKNGILGQQGASDIRKIKAGAIAYGKGNGIGDKAVYNMVSTPKGGQYQVTLSDGTGVWLNAASSIRFPTRFTGKLREVEITGEVYFEVAKNKESPFRVLSNGAAVEVLGTHFNVNAYHDEAELKTTLLEGAVKMTSGANSRLLKPGQQAVLNRSTGKMAVNDEINVEEVMAWKNGSFVFNGADIPSIMRELSRWYDVEVEYEGNIPTDRITGRITRNTNASNVLKILSLSDEHFRIEGRKIIVTSTKK